MKIKSFLFLYLMIINLGYSQYGFYPKSNPAELGKVKWLRNYNEALEQSKKQNLPVFILFQEVPGCSNCTTFGQEILSHPLLVEAIETCFVPLCIYNNKGGEDAKILEKYNEPAWNNPVIRIVDSKGQDLVARQPDFRYKEKTINTMISALIKSKNDTPGYLQVLADEWNAKSDEAYLSMFCFWTGEREIAGIDGVIGTEAGFMHGHEVVKVVFDKTRTNLDKIATQASKVQCADQIYGTVVQGKINNAPGKYRRDLEDKYSLYKSKYKCIPMTSYQKTLVNRALGTKQHPEKYLSPRQLIVLENEQLNKTDRRADDISDVWYKSK